MKWLCQENRHAVGIERKVRSVWTMLVGGVFVQSEDMELYSTLKQTEPTLNKWQRSNQLSQEWW